ncbi:MAG: nitroreductase [Pseudomonadota bacterium]
MDVSEAVAQRRSVRGYLDTPVDPVLLRDLAARAARAASGGNLQPWHVDLVHGESLKRLKANMAAKLAAREREEPGYQIYPLELDDPYRGRRFQIGEAMYGHIGIARDAKRERLAWFARNYQFFGAPAAYFVTVARGMGPPQWSDLGMYLATLSLLAVEAGLGTCAQECWAMYPRTVEQFLGTPGERMLFCGMAIGYEDAAEPANRLRSERAPVGEWLVEHG